MKGIYQTATEMQYLLHDVILNVSDDSTPHEVLFKIVTNARLINDTVTQANLSQKRMVVTLRQTNKQTRN